MFVLLPLFPLIIFITSIYIVSKIMSHIYGIFGFAPDSEIMHYFTSYFAFVFFCSICCEIFKKVIPKILACVYPNYIYSNNQTLLHVCDDYNSIKRLLDYGLDPNGVDNHGNTPILVHKQPNALKLLLKRYAPHESANPNAINNTGMTCLNIYNSVESLAILYDNGFNLVDHTISPLVNVNNDTIDMSDKIKFVISKGISPNSHYSTAVRETVLMHYVENNNSRYNSQCQYNIIKTLLDCGANPNIPSSANGQTCVPNTKPAATTVPRA